MRITKYKWYFWKRVRFRWWLNLLNGILAPSIWKNYIARNSKFEEVTFTEMVSKYKWWSNQNSIPKRCYTTVDPGFYKQSSFSELKKYRDDEDNKNKDIHESDQMKEIRKHQKNMFRK